MLRACQLRQRASSDPKEHCSPLHMHMAADPAILCASIASLATSLPGHAAQPLLTMFIRHCPSAPRLTPHPHSKVSSLNFTVRSLSYSALRPEDPCCCAGTNPHDLFSMSLHLDAKDSMLEAKTQALRKRGLGARTVFPLRMTGLPNSILQVIHPLLCLRAGCLLL